MAPIACSTAICHKAKALYTEHLCIMTLCAESKKAKLLAKQGIDKLKFYKFCS